jgi:hypothetical protein
MHAENPRIDTPKKKKKKPTTAITKLINLKVKQLVGERLEENKFKILELNLYIKIKNKNKNKKSTQPYLIELFNQVYTFLRRGQNSRKRQIQVSLPFRFLRNQTENLSFKKT